VPSIARSGTECDIAITLACLNRSATMRVSAASSSASSVAAATRARLRPRSQTGSMAYPRLAAAARSARVSQRVRDIIDGDRWPRRSRCQPRWKQSQSTSPQRPAAAHRYSVAALSAGPKAPIQTGPTTTESHPEPRTRHRSDRNPARPASAEKSVVLEKRTAADFLSECRHPGARRKQPSNGSLRTMLGLRL
jgi:hypothetical protein